MNEGKSHFKKCLIAHCAPTLAGIKTANLFSYKFPSKEIFANDIHDVNMILNPKGIFVEILYGGNNSAQILVYRLSRLSVDLERDGVKEFLNEYGYRTNSISECLSRLKERFLSCNIPHEVGLFLGYPLPDVIGFIKNKGKNCKCSGCWKVYHNEYDAEKLFAKYQKCKNIYWRLFSQGKPIEKLIVAA